MLQNLFRNFGLLFDLLSSLSVKVMITLCSKEHQLFQIYWPQRLFFWPRTAPNTCLTLGTGNSHLLSDIFSQSVKMQTHKIRIPDSSSGFHSVSVCRFSFAIIREKYDSKYCNCCLIQRLTLNTSIDILCLLGDKLNIFQEFMQFYLLPYLFSIAKFLGFIKCV